MAYLFLPIIGGIFWGLCYACLEQTLTHVTAPTWYVVAGAASLFVGLFFMPKLTGQAIDFKPLMRKEVLIIAAVGLIAAQLADMSITVALTKSPATYVAFGEVSYVLFLPIIAFFLFKDNQITPQMLGGGVLVLAGIAVLLMGQTKDAPQLAATNTPAMHAVSVELVPNES